jgi:hypothetical protein
MRLLVSVRSAAEVEAAVEGGAEIIDAKEPSHGSLGAVDPVELARIASAVPDGMPLSVALGDHSTPETARHAFELIRAIARRPTELYVKIGFAGLAEGTMVRTVLEAAVETARGSALRPEVIAVAYADHHLAGTVDRHAILDAAAGAGARGVLLDTWTKDGRGLFAWALPADIGQWLTDARRRRLLTALAGSLAADQMDLVCGLGTDVLGVRGAACEYGRKGTVSARLVRQLAVARSQASPPLVEAM